MRVGHTVRPILSDRLVRRLESMGIAVAWIDDSGSAAVGSASRPIEQLVMGSRLLCQSLRQQWSQLLGSAGNPHEVWPGLCLVTLAGERRRRVGVRPREIPVAVLMTPQLLESEQFQLITDAQGVDRKAVCSRIDRRAFISCDDLPRVAKMLGWLQQDAIAIERDGRELMSLSQKLGESYEELSLLYKLSAKMLVNQPPSHFLTEACEELLQVLGLKWLVLQLVDAESRLDNLAGQMFTAGPVAAEASLLRRIGKRLIAGPAKGAQSMIVDDTRKLQIEPLVPLGNELLLVSLMRNDTTYGIIFGCDKLDGSHISSIDSKLCSSLASSLSIFLENTVLFDEMQSMFMGTLHALTSSIDAKDSYTHGHSERVALLARLLAKAAGIDDDQVERVYLSALVHDVGKIGVPEAVLCKPGRLTTQEMELIKQHPVIGARILQDIRQMQDLIPGVLYHHERWDGAGYPEGQRGEDIPLFGRLICLADSFDAMSSNRTYRKAMNPHEIREEILKCAGTQFDPELAPVFVGLDFKPFFELTMIHQKKHHVSRNCA